MILLARLCYDVAVTCIAIKSVTNVYSWSFFLKKKETTKFKENHTNNYHFELIRMTLT